jgi:hypothetical protein
VKRCRVRIKDQEEWAILRNLEEEGGNVRDEQAKHGTQTFINFPFEVWAFKAKGSDILLGRRGGMLHTKCALVC